MGRNKRINPAELADNAAIHADQYKRGYEDAVKELLHSDLAAYGEMQKERYAQGYRSGKEEGYSDGLMASFKVAEEAILGSGKANQAKHIEAVKAAIRRLVNGSGL